MIPVAIVFAVGSGSRARLFYDSRHFAIVPMGFCYPGKGRSGDLPPRPECARTWRAEVLAAHPSVELVVAIGRYAVRYHTGDDRLSAAVEGWRSRLPGLVPLPHPSPRNQHWWQKRPWFERELLPALRERVADVLRGAR